MRDTTYTANCPLCGAIQEIAINHADYEAWQAGTLAQEAFPYLTSEQREALQTGICTPCWDRSFGED